MKLKELIPVLENIAPPTLAEDFDTGRIGLVLDRAADIQKIAVALDPTDYVLNEAARPELMSCAQSSNPWVATFSLFI